jgi:ADP-heptose:LPS heptosyltransferase
VLKKEVLSVKSYVALQALGDNLISLSLLSHLKGNVEIIGTKHTKNVANIIDVNRFNISVLFDDIPGFYDIKNKGLLSAIKDIFKFRKFIKNNHINELVFEKKDFRVFLLTFGLKINIFSPIELTNVYLDRARNIESAFHQKIKVKNCIEQHKNIRKILISPVTRILEKNITHEDMGDLINILSHYDFTIVLVDYSNSYSVFRDQVDSYITGTSLIDVKKLIIDCDAFIGPDSFLIHLAYFYGKFVYVIFNKYSVYFLPPGCEECKNFIIVSANISFKKYLISSFKDIGLIEGKR